MILYIFGEDTFRSRQYVRHSTEQFDRQRDPSGYNQKVINGRETTIGTLFAELCAAPFLAEKRFVVVENILSSSDKEMLGAVIERLEKKTLPESSVILFWQGEPHSKVKEAKELHALLSKEKYAQEFELLAGEKLANFVLKELQQLGATIDTVALNRLISVAGKDMWQMHFLIRQLSAFKKGAMITVADVQEFTNEKVDDNVFAMVEALIAGNHEQCFKLLGEQRRQGEEEIKLFGLVLWQFRTLLSVSDLLEREGNLASDAIASRLKIHPFVAKKNMALTKRFSLARLEALYAELLEIDTKTKSGQADPGLLMDLFVARI